jgi:NAD(P)-dependent dehydrogenase (short-subunit alcohol dehydrogenase family)
LGCPALFSRIEPGIEVDALMNFDGKTALITGAASGIGRDTALGYARGGGSVAILDYNVAGARAVADEIKASGGRAIAIATDIRRREDCEAGVKHTLEEFGRVDFLFNNAFARPSDFIPSRLADLPLEHWDEVMDSALNSVFWFLRAVLPVMVDQKGGSIVNTASIAGLRGMQGNTSYAVAKAGVINLTRCVALEYAAYNIRCNAIAPGNIDTAILRAHASKRPLLEKLTPLQRIGQPSDVANTALFLASDLASFVTGAVNVVDGGQSISIGLPAQYE